MHSGVSFCGRRGWSHGLLVTLAIGLHNIPEGLAVATVLVARGTTPRKALEWTLLCALPQPLFAVPSYIFVDSFRALLPASMGFAAGCMIWIVIAELLPDALEALPAGADPVAPGLGGVFIKRLRPWARVGPAWACTRKVRCALLCRLGGVGSDVVSHRSRGTAHTLVLRRAPRWLPGRLDVG